MSVDEELIAQWILREASAEHVTLPVVADDLFGGCFRHDGEGYVFDGDKDEYWVEVTVLKKGDRNDS